MTVLITHAADAREASLRRIISTIANTPPDAFGLDDELRTTLGLDSLSALRVSAGVEREFAVIIPDEKLHDLPTLRAMLEYLDRTHTT